MIAKSSTCSPSPLQPRRGVVLHVPLIGVWFGAGRIALTEPRIWRAVCELGRALNDGHWPADVRETGSQTGTMCGATARSIIRKAGIFPGMLGEKVREISRESLSRRLQNGIMRAERAPVEKA